MNRTLSGKPAMSEARRNHIHGPLISALEDDATWLPFRNTMILLVAITWMTAGAIFLIVEFG